VSAAPLRDDLLARARKAFRAGDAESALPLFQAAAEASDASVRDHLEWADALWSDFQFEQAFQVLRKAAERAPNDSEPLLLAAKRSFSLGRFNDCAQFLQAALDRNPGDRAIMRMRAEVLERQGRQSEAEILAREAVEKCPGDPRAIRALAHVLRGTNRVDQAAELLQRFLAENTEGEIWRAQHELAACLDRLSDYDGAMLALLAAKAQLRPSAQPLLQEWHTRARRREEFALALDAPTLRQWAGAVRDLRSIAILAGHPRSGTTLLEQMLGAHSRVITTDETGVLRTQFVEPIVLQAASTTEALREVNAFDAEQLASGRAFYFRATEAHLGEPVGERLLIEKDPLATCDLGFMFRLLPEARVIFPLRDPRDVCVSYFFTLVPLNADSAPALDLASTCATTALSLRLWQHWKSIIPQRWIETRYEHLVQDPRAELSRLLATLDLPWQEDLLASHQRDRNVRTPTYADVLQPLHTRAIGRWRHYERWLDPHLHLLQAILKDFDYGA